MVRNLLLSLSLALALAIVPSLASAATFSSISWAVTGGAFGGYNVPKRELVSNLAIQFQSERLKIARNLPEAAQLVEELQNFKMKITLAGNDTYEAWRESDHDDLVLAAAMAAWYGEKKLHSILHLPPMPRPPIETRAPTLDEIIKLQSKSGGDGRRERI